MFGKLKNLFGGDSGIEVTAPVAGKVVALEDVPDPRSHRAFSARALRSSRAKDASLLRRTARWM
ncbi:MAG: hypothetical protein ACLSGI_05230 [Butyricicoccaceae bacterium]